MGTIVTTSGVTTLHITYSPDVRGQVGENAEAWAQI